MDICDFMYRNELLSDHGYMLGSFDNGGSASVGTTDSQTTYENISMFGGKYFPIINGRYDSTLEFELSICKSDVENPYITPAESADLKQWLCSKKPQEFRMGGEEYEGVFWIGVFNVEEIRCNSERVGFNLKFISIAPFGYKDRVVLTGSVESDGIIYVGDTSDEEGFIYPDVVIEPQSSGTLTITNLYDGRKTVVKNCIAGESITFTHLLQIHSSKSSHNICDSFNFNFLRINNSYDKHDNIIKFSLPCTYSISYNPIAKVVMA